MIAVTIKHSLIFDSPDGKRVRVYKSKYIQQLPDWCRNTKTFVSAKKSGWILELSSDTDVDAINKATKDGLADDDPEAKKPISSVTIGDSPAKIAIPDTKSTSGWGK